MDILSHGLWAGAVCKAINKKTKKPLNIKIAAFWGIFPDIFAFAAPFIWLFWNLIFGGMSLSDIPRADEIEPLPQDTLPIFKLTSLLYSVSHSAIVFLFIFAAVYFVFRRLVWELGGWFLHIILDIPTHSYQFYPTPFLWPVSDWKFSGFLWTELWFLIPNYAVLIIIFLFLRKKTKAAVNKTACQ